MDGLTAVLYVAVAFVFIYVRGRVDGRNAERRRTAAPASAVPPPSVTPLPAAVAALMAFDPPVAIGMRFTYLGIEMLCTSHLVARPWGFVPGMLAEYAANDGTVRQTMFAGSEIDALKQEIARRGVTA